jgi:hypothetical protein
MKTEMNRSRHYNDQKLHHMVDVQGSAEEQLNFFHEITTNQSFRMADLSPGKL